MAENTTPSNFITPSSIDNLSIAGISVWLICIVVESFDANIDSFWIRITAICVSFLWSISLFIKNKRWNKPTNYIIIIVNAVLIYVNAAGINTITRQSPFEGRGIKTTTEDIAKQSPTKASIFNIEGQKDWYPDYKMIEYIDTLKKEDFNKSLEIDRLKNRLSYLKDEIQSVTKDTTAIGAVKYLLADFDRMSSDYSNVANLKKKYEKQIDSLKEYIEFQDKYPTVIHEGKTYYMYGNKQMSADEVVNIQSKEIDSLNEKVSFLTYEKSYLDIRYRKSRAIIDIIKEKKIIPANIDSL